MSNLIQVLPSHIANQIAAGEVIQRPASAVKELLENAVDAGASEIKLVVLDAGKSLIQVIDNGKGMNAEDAKNCFERHATSKISEIDDLFKIRTMGFRGEALASIAAVAQVELKTKREEDEYGTWIEIENSKILRQEPVVCSNGTSISMKNLFFNVPVRRNFLKSNTVEIRHITDEFIHVALAFPYVAFTLINEGGTLFQLERGTLKQRIIQLMGNVYATKLVSVEERTEYLEIKGFVGKPDTAKKTRGDQYLFVNERFVKNPYLSHAIVSAYEEMIAPGSFPFFALFIELDPARVDVNVHPTKQEIKFEDEKLVYTFIKSAIRHALAQFSISPALDFNLDPSIQQTEALNRPISHDIEQRVQSGDLYKSFIDRSQAHRIESSSNLKDWKSFFTPSTTSESVYQETFFQDQSLHQVKRSSSLELAPNAPLFQMNLTYIVFEQSHGITILHQQLAHQQILFEKFNTAWQGKAIPVQQNLFPQAIQFSPSDAQIIQHIIPDLLQVGYQLEPFGNNAFLLQGVPADYATENDQSVIEMILEDIKENTSSLHRGYKERMAKTLARKHAVKPGTVLDEQAMRDLVFRLSLSLSGVTHFDGKPLLVEVKKDYLSSVFGL